MTRNANSIVMGCLLATVGSWGGCESAPPTSSSNGRLDLDTDHRTVMANPCSPFESICEMQRSFRARDFATLADCVVADRRDDTVELLAVAADVLDANAALQAAARTKYDREIMEANLLEEMQNNLGPCSMQLRFVNMEIKGDRALVTFQEGGNIPLTHAQMEWSGDQWRYRPEPASRELVDELMVLARMLRDISEKIDRGAPVLASAEAFVGRVYPQMTKLAKIARRPEQIAAGNSQD